MNKLYKAEKRRTDRKQSVEQNTIVFFQKKTEDPQHYQMQMKVL